VGLLTPVTWRQTVRLFRALLLVAGATIVVQSLPDVARYLRMRNL
jgi:hypothetical protein